MGERVRWRAGTSVGRTLYIQTGATASKGDRLIGMMDTPAMAALVVAAVNRWYDTGGYGPPELLADPPDTDRWCTDG